jgi:hypothetical protein
MLLYDTGNLVIQNGGVFSDTGERLKVVGNVLVSGSNLVTTNSNSILRGSGATAGTTVLTLNQQGGTLSYRFRNDGRFYLGSAGNSSPHFVPGTLGNSPILLFRATGTGIPSPQGVFTFAISNPLTDNTDKDVGVKIGINFAPTSGSNQFITLQCNPSISFDVAPFPICRAVYINPTITSAAEFRGIETTNNTGYQFYFAGSIICIIYIVCVAKLYQKHTTQ